MIIENTKHNKMSENKTKNGKKTLYLIVVVLIIASFAFRLLNDWKIEQTSILFVGIPALMAVLLIKYHDTPKSAYGVVFKTITLFLLMSAILLGEGLVCIIFMAPIFYAVGGICVALVEYLKKRNKSKLNAYVLIPVLLIISQGYEINNQPKINSVETSIQVNGVKSLERFKSTPNFLKNLPNFFKIGFPEPISITGNGLNIGDIRKIEFESKTKGIGALVLKIKSKEKNTLTFEIIEDRTHINHWLTWKEIEVEIINNGNNTSTITWTTHFTCDLGPSWYFNPIESYGVEVMNRHLINSYFQNHTP